MSRYLRILRIASARDPFIASVVARLPISMVPLGLVLLVQEVRGSYSVAGVVTASFALATGLATPWWGRLLDRFGLPRIIAGTACASSLLLSALAVAAARSAADLVLVVLAVGVGLTFPPVSPAMRAAWRVALPEELDRRAGFALDAVAVETIFVAGPLLLSGMLLLAPRVVPLLVTAALMAAGGTAFAATPAARSWTPEASQEVGGAAGRSPLRSRGVLALLIASIAMAVGFGQLDVSIAALSAAIFGSTDRVGVLFAAIAGGSASGGLFYGSRAWSGPERARLPVVLVGFALGAGGLSLVARDSAHPALALALPVLAVTGLLIAPALIIQANLMDRLAPRDRLSEAQAWLNMTYTTGGAAGTAVAGLLIDAGGPSNSFLGACLAITVGATLAFTAQSRWRTARLPVAATS